ncbi:MAG TPA: flagellar biosynthetic protein FliO [Steroidobacteraceae bacterium]|jgi:flagellar protein FliO/FliZ|nr:flagellar biosynthetic protein FliO [Steroidobacteraceae bacterium]
MSDPTLFAAPETASHGTAAGGTLDVTLALLLIVGVIVLLAWGLKRMRRFGIGGHDRIQVLSERAVGPKERCLLVRVGDTDILVGVASGSVNTLHVFPPGSNTEAPPAPVSGKPALPNFKDMLLRSLGK